MRDLIDESSMTAVIKYAHVNYQFINDKVHKHTRYFEPFDQMESNQAALIRFLLLNLTLLKRIIKRNWRILKNSAIDNNI